MITGIGVVSAFGLGAEALVAGLRAGRPALSPLPFPAAGFPHQQGARGPERSVLARLVLRRKDLKLMSPDALLAVAAGVLAWQDAGLPPEPPAELADEVGLFLAVGSEKGEVTDLAPAVAGSLQHGRLELGLLAARGLSCINPLDSLKTLPNMALAHLAIRLGLRGPSLACCGPADAGRLALDEARRSVAAGECPLALAGGADSLVSFAGYVQAWRRGELEGSAVPGEAAAVFVVEDEATARARGARPYGEPPGAPAAEVVQAAAGHCGAASWPLALAAALHESGRGEAAA